MRRHFRTLRFKFAALNLLVFGAILTTLCIVILAVYERYLLRDFDERLIDRADRVVEAIEVTEPGESGAKRRKSPQPTLNPFRFPGHYIQLRAADGEILERSRNLGKVTLPLTEPTQRAARNGDPVLETYSDEMAHSLLGSEGQIRLLTLFHKRPNVAPFYIQVGLTLAPVNYSISQLRRLFVLLVPVGLLIVGMASWLIASRSLAPITKIVRHAQALTAAHLDRRLSLPVAQDEVAQLVMTLNQMLDRLEAAFRAQERFIADASHELRTPITVLLGEAQILTQQARKPEEYDRFVASVEDVMRHLAKLVDSLLTLARADAGFPLQGRVPVSINEIVMDAVERCQGLARQRDVRLVPVLVMPKADEPEPQTQGDTALLCAMTENLIRNAVRYSPPGQAVDVTVVVDRMNVTVSVLDHGPGIPPEHLDRVFERFYRLPRGGQGDQGTGLGLAIARGVAHLHHGTLTVANRPGGGCEFVARLPLAVGDEGAEFGL